MSIIEINNPKLNMSLVKFQKIDSSPRDCYDALYEASYVLAYEVAKHLDYYETKIRTVNGKDIVTTNLNHNFTVLSRMNSGLIMEKPFLNVLNANRIGHFEFADNTILLNSSKKHSYNEKVVILDPVLCSYEASKCIIDDMITSGFSAGDIILASLVALPAACTRLIDEYPDLQIITGSCTDNFDFFQTDDPFEDWVSYYIYGGNNKISELKDAYLQKMYELY